VLENLGFRSPLLSQSSESSPICLPSAPFHRNVSLIHPRPPHHCYWFTKKLSCLCLLDLSAAFDTIDHDILLTLWRCSTSRLCSWSLALHNVYNSCTLISSLSLYHHLYADDTTFTLLFHPSDFQTSIPQTFRQASLTSRTLSHRSLPGSLLISYHSIPATEIHNSSTSIDELNIKSSLSQNSHSHSATNCSASSWSQHTLFTLRHSDQTIFITQSHSPLLPTCFTSSVDFASLRIPHPNYSSPSQRPSFEYTG